MSILSI